MFRVQIAGGFVVKDIPRMQSVMIPMPHSIEAHETLVEAHERMEQYQVRHLPVIENEKLAGLISIGDVVHSVIVEQEFVIDLLEQYIMAR